jgi:2-keto-3-deoxy-6-phosphogluconate aldolase
VVSAGASFLVSNLPFAPKTYERHGENQVLVPGVTTPGEAFEALNLGANLLRFVVPHIAGGAGYLRALDALTHQGFPFFIAGPVRFELLAGYIGAGALVSGVAFDTMLGPDYRPMQRAYDEEYVREALLRFLRPIERSRSIHFEGVPFAGKDPVEITRACGRCLNV